jgi:hypothetical protein
VVSFWDPETLKPKKTAGAVLETQDKRSAAVSFAVNARSAPRVKLCVINKQKKLKL